MKRTLIFLVFFFVLLSFNYAQGYSIKNRWNTKLSLSFNRTNESKDNFMRFFEGSIHPLQARLNARAECNYGVLSWVELGGYLGYIRYDNPSTRKKYKSRGDAFYWIGFAPTFGVNVNVHLLPFWVKKDCRWELYLTAEYGGAYLVNYLPVTLDVLITNGDNKTTHFHAEDGDARYRHVFGAGLGGGVYFEKKKQVFGLYTEASVGQYSYFPKMCKVHWTARVGIEFKFYSKKHKEKMRALELKPNY